MVQGGLLTAYPGGDHGDGEASGGQSSLRQGAGIASPGDLEIRIDSAAEQWTKSRNGVSLEGLWSEGIYRPKGNQRGAPLAQEARGRPPGARLGAAWMGGSPPSDSP